MPIGCNTMRTVPYVAQTPFLGHLYKQHCTSSRVTHSVDCIRNTMQPGLMIYPHRTSLPSVRVHSLVCSGTVCEDRGWNI